MEKRIIIAFILSFGILYAFRAFYIPSEPVPSQGAAASAPISAPEPKEEPPKTVEPPEATPPATSPKRFCRYP